MNTFIIEILELSEHKRIIPKQQKRFTKPLKNDLIAS